MLNHFRTYKIVVCPAPYRILVPICDSDLILASAIRSEIQMDGF